ncbi:hypothetical protein KQI11_02835 [Acetanaerobacterium sp. MSJ-12]|uniref:hypothetical protein n=1 Tax=Acetanaerobacterium sp. MSJ-12 TaxID=2841535 RepID=UPI001C0F151C|nr:hypothetical protein [Acetanaerobacterium sp. MSJ-12]MBU5419060.1 hypothetical protein [Acetanaerobacterium sp. MSJ-12]
MVKNRWKWMAALLVCCLVPLVGTSASAFGADLWEDTKGGVHVFDSAQCLEDPSALEKRCAALIDEFEFDLIIISQYDNSTYAPPDLDHRLEEVLRQRYGYGSYKRIDAAVMFINARKGTCELGVWGQFDSFSPGDGTAFTYDELAFAMIDDLTAQLQLASDKGRYHPISWRHRRHVLYSALFGAAVFVATVCLLARRRQKEQNAELRQSVSYTVRPLAGGELLYRSTGHSHKGAG